MRENVYRQKLDIIKLLKAYVKKWWLIVFCTALTAAAAWFYTENYVTPLYRTSTTMYVNNGNSEEAVELIPDGNINASKQLVSTYMTIITSNPILEKVAEVLGPDYYAWQIRSVMDLQRVNETEIFQVTITGRDPAEVVAICNAIAEVAPGELEKIVEGSSSKVINYPEYPSTSYYPSSNQNAVLGGAAGGALVVVWLTLRYLTDNRVKDENDLEQLFGLPVLSRIPESKIGRKKSSGTGEENTDGQ